MQNYVMINLLKGLLNELDNGNGYKVAAEFKRDEITMKNITYEQLKEKAFEMACALVHIYYELYKDVEAMKIISKAENYNEVVEK